MFQFGGGGKHGGLFYPQEEVAMFREQQVEVEGEQFQLRFKVEFKVDRRRHETGVSRRQFMVGTGGVVVDETGVSRVPADQKDPVEPVPVPAVVAELRLCRLQQPQLQRVEDGDQVVSIFLSHEIESSASTCLSLKIVHIFLFSSRKNKIRTLLKTKAGTIGSHKIVN